jgi:N-acetylmuramoyl-L-alanine amidase
MIGAALLALAPLAAAPLPARQPVAVIPSVLVETPRGAQRLPVRADLRAGPQLSADALLRLLGGTRKAREAWVEVVIARQTFRFLPGAAVLVVNDRLQPLAGYPITVGDSLFLPLQFVTEVLPGLLSERYAWDPARARFREAGRPAPQAAPVARLPNGLLPGHVVAVDPGHGGKDPGNLGLYLPRGVNEKHITLQVGVLLRDELRRRGVKVVMTRTTDTLISILDRASYCTNECALFVSLHVDALPANARRRFTEVSGFHTIIIGDENTEDADRIARMENEALQYETATLPAEGDLDFILRNLQFNEYLRESARAAELVQENIARVHTGTDRGVKQNRQLAVLNTARRPAILVELGFGTNPADSRLMANRKSQQALATALADAIVAYLLEYERKIGGGPAGGGR